MSIVHLLPLLLCFVALSSAQPSIHTSQPETDVYIVHTHGVQPYTSMLAASKRIIHTYETVLTGFAVRLTADEATHMSNLAGVRAVYRSRILHTQTTRSPGFLGLQEETGAWPESEFGDGVIIGLIDTGISPDHPSFHDAGLGPVRPTWKGKCVEGDGFDASSCNNKLVGAKAFLEELVDGEFSPMDRVGHGTHVAATAAGSRVRGASLLNFSRGDAMGTAPNARMAVYKVCRSAGGCPDWAVVAAVDAAVSDAVDIISMSLGGPPTPLYDDALAVATFGAVRRGVFVVLAGGNGGPRASTVTNAAPWMTTVGATTMDRVFPAILKLGNGDGVALTGQSLYSMKAQGTISLVNSSCDPDDLTPDRVMGKVVVCFGMAGAGGWIGTYIQRAGGAGIVSTEPMERWGDAVMAELLGIPGLALSYTAGKQLEQYLSATPYPVASFTFTCDTVTGANRAPKVAGFSSRGPSRVAREILKPDLIAPGVNVLAAWIRKPEETTEEQYNYNIISGTSMACPHVAGVAALLKKRHADWTPAMMRSALMTTATMTDKMEQPILDSGVDKDVDATPLVAGAGIILPMRAMDPGMVYDAGAHDYVEFLCGLDYTAAQIRRFEPEFANCTGTAAIPGGAANLNYPSMVVVFDGSILVRRLSRTLTTVSHQGERYEVRVAAPDGVVVTVTPTQLDFKHYMEQKMYTVEVRTEAVKLAGAWEFGDIVWENAKHRVRSPVAVTWIN